MKASKVVGMIVKVGLVIGTIGGILYITQKSVKEAKHTSGRYRQYYELTNKWLENKMEGKNIQKFFADGEYKKIAIYGMGTLAELIYNEIKGNENIEVSYFIDKNAEELYYGLDELPVIGLDDIDSQEKVDFVIVTPIFDFDDIVKDLEKEGITEDLISLEDIIYEA